VISFRLFKFVPEVLQEKILAKEIAEVRCLPPPTSPIQLTLKSSVLFRTEEIIALLLANLECTLMLLALPMITSNR